MSSQQIVIVASRNPVKRGAAEGAFARMVPGESFEMVGVDVDSGVADQPLSDQEALGGAEERAAAVAELRPEADFWVGIEGGIEDSPVGMRAFAWVVIRSGFGICRARSGSFFLPDLVARLFRQG